MSRNELPVDFITSLDGYGAAEGRPGFRGLQGPEYLAWFDEVPERDYTILMGANTYRQMYGFALEFENSIPDEIPADENDAEASCE
jgi:dihydrofolate reductase